MEKIDPELRLKHPERLARGLPPTSARNAPQLRGSSAAARPIRNLELHAVALGQKPQLDHHV